MKIFIIKRASVVFWIVLLSFSSSNRVAAKQTTGRETIEVEVPLKTLLIPSLGFEERNNVVAVLHGTFPNACYTLGRHRIDIDKIDHSIRVSQFANLQTGGVCAEENTMPPQLKMTVPFTNEVFAGSLPAGDYQFIFQEEGNVLGNRPFNVAPNQVPAGDTFPYAAILNMSAPDVVSTNDEIQVTLSGVLNSTCTKLAPEVRVIHENDVFVVLATVIVKKGVVCTEVLTPFEITVKLGKTLPGIYLIHARSMNGKAVNRVVRITP